MKVSFPLSNFRKLVFNKTLVNLVIFYLPFLLIDRLPLEVDYMGSESNLYFIMEDGSKLMGIATWCFYLCRLCYEQVVNPKNPYSPVDNLK